MKRIISALAAAVLMSAACISAFASEKPTFSVTDASGGPGEEVTVRCEIRENPGIIAFHLLVDYDTDALTLTEASGGIFKDTKLGDTEKAPFSFLWAEAVTGTYTDNGTIAELTFRIKDGASAGDHDITISYDPEDVFNYDMENVYFETEAGKITVTKGSHETSSVPADSSKTKSSSAADSKQEPAGDSSAAGGEESVAPKNDSSEKAPDSVEEIVPSQAESSRDKMSETDSSSSGSVPEKDSSDAAGTSSESIRSEESLASSEPAAGSRESSESVASPASSAAEENKSSAAPIVIIVLIAAAAGGAVFIIIMKKRKE